MQERIEILGTRYPLRRLRSRVWLISISVPWLWVSLFNWSNLAQLNMDSSITESIRYQQERNEWMRTENSPLALAGLFWLKPGDATIGTDATSQIVLPAGTAPPRVGRLQVGPNGVRFVAEQGVQVLSQDVRVTVKDLQIDGAGETPDVLSLGNLRIKIIKRGDRLGLRLINLKNQSLLHFKELEFYPINAAYRVEGKFIEYRPPKKIQVANILGQIEAMECPGVVEFSLQGQLLRLEPVLESPTADKLFIMFKDGTNGKGTYEGGRYLYAPLPSDRTVVLDFNQAHNPFCAYTSYSTCQIPPLQNWLRMSIPSGEKQFKKSGKGK